MKKYLVLLACATTVQAMESPASTPVSPLSPESPNSLLKAAKTYMQRGDQRSFDHAIPLLQTITSETNPRDYESLGQATLLLAGEYMRGKHIKRDLPQAFDLLNSIILKPTMFNGAIVGGAALTVLDFYNHRINRKNIPGATGPAIPEVQRYIDTSLKLITQIQPYNLPTAQQTELDYYKFIFQYDNNAPYATLKPIAQAVTKNKIYLTGDKLNTMYLGLAKTLLEEKPDASEQALEYCTLVLANKPTPEAQQMVAEICPK